MKEPLDTVRRMRAVHIAPIATNVRRDADGSVHLASPVPLPAYPDRITARLETWAARAPDRPFLAQRGADGRWRRLTYSETLARVRRIARALVDRGLSAERPVVILSGNGLEHALLALASMYAGVLYSPVAPAYSLQARDHSALGRIFELLRPGLVFAAEGASFEAALDRVMPGGAELVTSSPAGDPVGRWPATPFAELEHREATPAVDDAHARVGPDTLAKILFTSGSTGRPKGVINTQRMLCANQAMILSVLAFLGEEPPVLCDWLPWNHTAGGNHNFGLVLYNGGTFYIDEGRPTPGAFDTTVRNLREVAATTHFTVPRTYEMLLPHLRTDAVLRERFFERLQVLFYAAAGLSQRFFDELRAMALETCGEEILWMTGFGATETAPFALSTGPEGASAGVIGLPAPGMELKLTPVGSKLEARVRGPNVTPGYWRDEALTRAAFDEDGFYRMGDAMQFVDPADPARGLRFDGRLAEDFKLSTGTWVSVGPLRTRLLAAGEGYIQDAVITGHDREFVGALLFPNVARCAALCPEVPGDAPLRDLVGHPRVAAAVQHALERLAAQGTGSSTVVARAMLLDEPASIDAREITDKGSLNQKAVLRRRAALVDELYAKDPPARVLRALR